MASDTITFMLEGEITLDVFSTAVAKFRQLIDGLSLDEGGDIQWVIDDLAPGSALATIKGFSDDLARVDRVSKAYLNVGRALQTGDTIVGSRKVVTSAKSFLRMVRKEQVATIKFETPEADAVISRTALSRRPRTPQISYAPEPPPRILEALEAEPTSIESFGAVEGVVETLARRHGLRFTLYESLTDRPVSCYLTPGQEEMMRNAWGKQVIVEGRISRDETGRAITVRDVTDIIPSHDEGDFLQAGMALPLGTDDLLPEEIIRRLRDG